MNLKHTTLAVFFSVAAWSAQAANSWWQWHPVVDRGPGNYLSGAVLSGTAGATAAIDNIKPLKAK